MADDYAQNQATLSDPARRAVAVTLDDANDLADVPKALYVGTGGHIAMIGLKAPVGAPGIVWKNVPAGTILPFRPRRILATGTTAADILALY